MKAGQFTNFKTHHLSIIGEAIDEYHHSMINIGVALFFQAIYNHESNADQGKFGKR